ncbi:MAG: hypothetical protein AAB468_02030 [Patescibacteria group bacterium]
MAKKTTHTTSEVKGYIDTIAEHFTDGFKAVGERIDGLQESMDRQFGEVNKRFEKIEIRLDSHTEMIGRVMVQLEEIKGELKQKVDYKDFARLELRVARLESRPAGKH